MPGLHVYTIREASRKTKIGSETLKRACEEGLINASRLPNKGWIISESALEEALHHGIDLRALKSKGKGGKKKAQPEHLRKYQEAKKKAAKG